MTGIEWTDEVWNPVTGCEKVSAGCASCYAERMFRRLASNPSTPQYHGRRFTDVRCHEERLGLPFQWKRPRRIFVNSMSDLFHEAVPDEFIHKVFAVMCACPRHTFIVLTKRSRRMAEFSRAHMTCQERQIAVGIVSQIGAFDRNAADIPREWIVDGVWRLPNLWLLVSVEDQPSAEARVPDLIETNASVLGVSYEPALGPVDLSPWLAGLHWVICGGESGPRARPMDMRWARSARDQCVAAGVPFFFKQWGEWGPDYYLPNEAPDNVRRVTLRGGTMVLEGKKRAGRTLDGREWNEYPALKANHDRPDLHT